MGQDGGFIDRHAVTLGNDAHDLVIKSSGNRPRGLVVLSSQDGSATIEIEPAGRSEQIDFPELFDSERSNCIGNQLGTLDYFEISILVDDDTTAENGALFIGCGFELYPPGTDFGNAQD